MHAGSIGRGVENDFGSLAESGGESIGRAR